MTKCSFYLNIFRTPVMEFLEDLSYSKANNELTIVLIMQNHCKVVISVWNIPPWRRPCENMFPYLACCNVSYLDFAARFPLCVLVYN